MAQIEPKRTSEDIDAVHFVQNEASDWYLLANEPTVSVGTTITIDGISYNLYDGDVRTTFGKAPVHPTGFETVDNDNNSKSLIQNSKLIKNGHLYILRDGNLFTATGARVK